MPPLKLPAMLSEATVAIATLNPWLAVCVPRVGIWLETWTEKVKLPAVVGVPLSTPAVENVRPGGSVPPAEDHV